MKNSIPERKDVPQSDKWDLSQLYKSDADWEKDLAKISELTEKVCSFKGKLSENSETLLASLKALEELDRTIEQVYQYASLQHSADEGDSAAQEKHGRVMMAVTDSESRISFYTPELMAIEDEKLNQWIEQPQFADFKIFVKKSVHMKPYILSEKEERILALQNESAQTAYNTFSLLTNVDLNFGTVKINGTEKALTQTTWSQFMDNPDREIRREAYQKFYATYEAHQNTLATLYAGSVNDDVFSARARG